MARPKAATKKTAARKTTTRKTTARNPRSFNKGKTSGYSARNSSDHGEAESRRPNPNAPPQPAEIDELTKTVMLLIENIDKHTANLRALDRMRHNGVGLKRLGFIEAAFRISKQFPQYFPHWLWTGKFSNDLLLFRSIRSLVEACRSLEEKAWNINVESSDMIYTDALEYYAQVQNAAERRIDAAESIYAELHGFFRNLGHTENLDLGGAAPTQKRTKRDGNALMKGKKDGEIIIKNISPKIMRGTREIIDRTFNDSASFKETDEGGIKE
jgi:hypothetical protein